MIDLPEGWAEVKLADVASWGSGGTPSRGNPAYYQGPIPWIKTGELGQRLLQSSEESISELALAESSAKLYPKGSVVLAMYGATIGKVSILGFEAATNQACAVGVPFPSAVTSEYLYYYLRSQEDAFRAVGQGGAQPNISQGIVRQWPMPLAPSSEQLRITEKLDAVLARVDACRDRLARVAPLLKRFRQSVLTAATSGQLTMDHTGDAIWPIFRAEDVCAKVQSGGTPKEGFTEKSGVPFLKVYNIVNQKVDFQYRPQFVSQQVHAGELGKSRALPGDVIMNIVGPPLGKVAVLPSTAAEWNINQAITLFRPSDRITSSWLYILLCEGAAVRDVLNRTKGSVGQINISLSQCRAFQFPVPPVDVQGEVARRVEALFSYADRLESRLAAAEGATDRLTPALLAKAFRGELVPQDPADEPASALLERIRTSRAEVPGRRGNHSKSRRSESA